MTRLPLSSEISRAQRRRDRLAADLAQAERELAALREAQAKLRHDGGAREGTSHYGPRPIKPRHRVLQLHSTDPESSIKLMESAESVETKKIGRPLLSDHPLPKRAVELHGSIKAAAKSIGVSPTTFRGWYAEKEHNRPIPQRMVDLFAKEPWNIPKSTWQYVS